MIKRQLIEGIHHVPFGGSIPSDPFLNGPSKPTQHSAADQLLEITDDTGLSLLLSKGAVTWEARNLFSTIDFVFMSEHVAEN